MNHEQDPGHHDHDMFKLSDEHIVAVFHDVAEALVRSGKITANNEGERYKKPTDRSPHTFVYDVPREVAKGLFFRGDEVILTEANVTYNEPYRVDEWPQDDEVTSVSVELIGRIPENNIDVSHLYHIGIRSTDTVTATVDVEYAQDGRVVSRGQAAHDEVYDANDIRHYGSLLDALGETSREMTLDDTEKIKILVEHIKAHPSRQE